MNLREIESHVNKFLKIVYKSFSMSQNSTIIKSIHSHSCKVCGSHPVNSVRKERVICRTCGTSYKNVSVYPNNRESYTGEVLLDLRKRV